MESSSKAALDSFVKTLAEELIDTPISVISIYPGIVDTDMFFQYKEQGKKKLTMDTGLDQH